MIREVMERADLTIWPIISLILFFSFAVLVGFWIFRKGSKETYDKLSRLSLDEDTAKEKQNGQSTQQ